ncbi:ATP-binding protein [Vibrio fluvialis]|nr:ATP-binding protein [Vibrio fluvialis]
MYSYDFSTINDKEFESLVNDLVSRELSIQVDSYKPGRDQGVDGRGIYDGKVLIIQSKHWLKSGFNKLSKHLTEVEYEKIKKISPSRYILATSIKLSRLEKEKIKKTLSPYILDINDVWGGEKINELLSKHPDVEKNYYNLWINSATVISAILNNATYTRSKYRLNEIIDNTRRYVETENHHIAELILKNNNVLIVTGAPGIGKTTLAEQMCKLYSAYKYSFYYIENNVNEIEDVYDLEKKQIFLFDDFLGSNFLEKIENKSDSSLVSLIKRVRKNKNKKLVLTTRTNIYNQAKVLSEIFLHSNMSVAELEVKVESLSKIDKAKILYNHLWFGLLPETYVEEIYKSLRYRKIIEHRNFNPRIIQFITDPNRIVNLEHGEYWNYICETLKNPKDIWRYVFKLQTNDICKHLVIALVFNGGSMAHREILSTFQSIINSGQFNTSDYISFDECISLLLGSMMNRSIILDSSYYYSLFNPSISDFVLHEYLKNHNYLLNIICNIKTNKFLDYIQDLFKNKIVSEELFKKILSHCLSIELVNEDMSVYDMNLLSLCCYHLGKNNRTIKNYIKNKNVVSYLQDDICSFNVLLFLIEHKFYNTADNDVIDFLNSNLDWGFSDEYFIQFSKLLKMCNLLNEDNLKSFENNLYAFYDQVITDIVIEQEMLGDLYDCYESIDYSKVDDYLNESLDGLAYDYDNELISNLHDLIDIDRVVERNIELSQEYDADDYYYDREFPNFFDDDNSIIDSYFRRK